MKKETWERSMRLSFAIKILAAQLLLLFSLSSSMLAFPERPEGSTLDTGFAAGVTKGDPGVYFSLPVADGKILVAGNFHFTNDAARAYFVRLNSDGSTDASFNASALGPNGSIFDLVVQPDGKYLIGGSFTTYNGTAKNRIARINADGTLDPTFNFSAVLPSSGYVYKIALQTDGKIVISGNMTGSIRRINSDGSSDASFISPYTSSYLVDEIAIQANGKILIGGSNNLARLNSDGTYDTTFAKTGVISGAAIFSIKILSDGKILIGGDFTSGGIFTAPSVRRINPDGSFDSSFSPGMLSLNNLANDIVIQSDGKILIAGYATSDGFSSVGLGRLNADGSSDAQFTAPTANFTSRHVSLQGDGKIILTGEFMQINGQSKPGIVRLNAGGTIDSSFNASFYRKTLTQTILQQPDGKIVVCGDFNFANGTSGSNIARFNSNGTRDTTFNTGTGLIPDFSSGGRWIYDAEMQPDGKIILAGIFYGYNGVKRKGILRLNSDGSLDNSFDLNNNSGQYVIYDILLLPDGRIVVSEFGTDPFTGFGYFGVNIYNSDGTHDRSLFGNDGVGRSVARQPDGKILVGGGFVGSRAILRFNADGTQDSTFNPATGFNGSILDMLVQPDGRILIGGSFTSVGGVTRTRIARLNSDGSLDTTFDPGSGADSTVWKFARQQNGKIFVGGTFSTFNGVSSNKLVRLNSDGSLDSTFASGLDSTASTVHSLVLQRDGKLLFGGTFDNYAGSPRNGVGRLLTTLTTPAPFDFDGDRRTDISIFRPSSGQWWYQRSSNGQVPAFQFGAGSDKIVPADFTGDGKSDLAVWRPSTGEWFILRSEDNSYYSFPFGRNGDIPAPGDFDGDGKGDSAVFRPSTATWYINKSSGGSVSMQFGVNGDIPVVADYDGDGLADIAIYRPSNGQWWLNRSSLGIATLSFGTSNDAPVQGDYTGDGKADLAFWRPSSGEWFVLRSENSSFYSVPFGANGDIPTPGDYDGDGRFDLAVFRPGSASWYINRSTSGLLIKQFGISSDKPVPSAYLP